MQCPVCHRPYIKSQYSCPCSSCKSWLHQKCSGIANASIHHNLWLCPLCQTPSPFTPQPLLIGRLTLSIPTSPQLLHPHHHLLHFPLPNVKLTLQSRFFHCVAPYLLSGVRPPLSNFVLLAFPNFVHLYVAPSIPFERL